ncbi:GNAT family N-acetyltransferase [Carnobacterium gallinarum]|uniref:GNAT family N-acetyltransferase n=1 Tax=Carnobacterium gallinarum TaxID=2749 RepID=UPI000556F4DA|nr:GNAT family protein [Carnobacterium gallinarum]
MEKYLYLLFSHQEIMGDRILLRPVQLSDAEDMFDYASDEETTQFVFPCNKTIEDAEKSIAAYFLKEPAGKYAVVLKKNNKMIGTIDLRVEATNKSAELGYVLNKAYWGKGYMTESGKLLLDFAFTILNLEKVYSLHDSDNTSSGKVMKRLGMTYEGTLRKNRLHKEKWSDDCYYSILKEEYFISQ